MYTLNWSPTEDLESFIFRLEQHYQALNRTKVCFILFRSLIYLTKIIIAYPDDFSIRLNFQKILLTLRRHCFINWFKFHAGSHYKWRKLKRAFLCTNILLGSYLLIFQFILRIIFWVGIWFRQKNFYGGLNTTVFQQL